MSKLTPTQQKQLAWLRKQEQNEAYQSLATLNQIDCTCKTCGKGFTANCADGARSFVLNHAGHYTWLQHLGRVKAQLPKYARP